MSRAALAHALLIGLAIAVLLSALTLAQMVWWPPRRLDGYPAAAGLLFLLMGLALGLRHRRAVASRGPDAISHPPIESTDLLTPREAEVLLRLAEGCSNREIAKRHFVSENTVKTQVRQVCEKIGAKSRLHAVARARELGWLAAEQTTKPEQARNRPAGLDNHPFG